jgi:hypothetical protein
VAANPRGVGGAARRPRERLSRRRRSAIVRGLRSLTASVDESRKCQAGRARRRTASTGTLHAIARGSNVLDLPVSEPRAGPAFSADGDVDYPR